MSFSIASARQSSIQSVANATIKITSDGLNSGATTTFTGIRLEGSFFDAEQSVDNSKRVPLIDGNTIALVNNATFGVATLNLSRVSSSTAVSAADVVLSCLTIQKSGISTGSTITIEYKMNGKTETWTFSDCTIMKCPPLKLAGDDVPTYTVTFSYGDYSVSVA